MTHKQKKNIIAYLMKYNYPHTLTFKVFQFRLHSPLLAPYPSFLLFQDLPLPFFQTWQWGGSGTGLSIPVPAPASMHPPRPQTISGVKIEHPTPPPMGTGLPAPPPPSPAKTLFFIKYLKNAYFVIFSQQQKHNNYLNNYLSNILFSKVHTNYNIYVYKE